MSKKTQILLNKKHKLLTSFLDDAKKINDLVPLVQEAKEETELSIAAIGDAPSEVANSFDDSYIYGTVESDYTLWEKSLPKISINSPFYVTASGSAASATTSDVVFSQINSLNNPSQPQFVQDWSIKYHSQYFNFWEKKNSTNEVIEKLATLNPDRSAEFIEANTACISAFSGAVPPKSAAIAMRNTLEHYKGDLLKIVQVISKKQIKKSQHWQLISDALAIDGVGSPQHSLLLGKEISYKDLHGDKGLTRIAKNLTPDPHTELKSVHQKWVNFFYTTLNLIDPKQIKKH